MKRLIIAAAFVGVASLGFAQPASAQRFGVQTNWADDFEFGVGLRMQTGIGGTLGFSGDDALADLQGVISLDYFFRECIVECRYWELNGNSLYPIQIGDSDVAPYLGAGFNLGYSSIEGQASEINVGLNLVGGLEFPIGDFDGYAEVKQEIGGGDQFVITAGFMVGGSG